ncbi:MAG: hypothetical protein IJR82_05435 [Bacilli bacterium]|nr:hypothetical protein [Bacilli bacterium]
MEYEYSFKVKDLTKYLDYCKKNDYQLVEETNQERILYRNANKTIARMTTKIKDNKAKIYLDFKDDNDSDEILKVSRETIPLEVTDSNKKAVLSILDMLGYQKDKILVRNRWVYKKDKVTFEIDDYKEPQMKVVAIEGNKE